MYLHVVSGPYSLLFHAEDIREVLDLRAGSRHLQGELAAHHRVWRNRMLPEVDLRALFRLPAQTADAALVYGTTAAEPNCVVEVDSISGLVHLNDEAFVPVPAISAVAQRMFDAVHANPRTGRSLLRLKRGLDLPALASDLQADTVCEAARRASPGRRAAAAPV